jgi:glycosyltransferase involved in cell wall biosynthesis
MRLKIGIISHVKHSICEPFAGGLECHTAALTQALSARGHDVTLLSAGEQPCSAQMEIFCKETKPLEGEGDGGFGYEHQAYFELMRKLGRRSFDIIHNNSLHYLPLAMAGLLSIPMVTTLHTPAFWEMAGSIQLSPHPNSFFAAVSETIRSDWEAVMAVDSVIPNGIDLDKFVYRPQPDASPYLFWSGRIVPEKGPHLAIEAARLARIPLLFAGPVSDIAYFESQIRPVLGEHARYLGHLAHDRLIALMGGARACLCTPVWEEPYGLVVAEALACGTPVAGFARGALPGLLDARSGILVEPNNAEALALAAVSVQSLSRADCRRRAAEIGDAERMIEAYEALYARLCQTDFTASSRAGPGWYESLVSRKLLKSHYLRHASADLSEVA